MYLYMSNQPVVKNKVCLSMAEIHNNELLQGFALFVLNLINKTYLKVDTFCFNNKKN